LGKQLLTGEIMVGFLRQKRHWHGGLCRGLCLPDCGDVLEWKPLFTRSHLLVLPG